MFDMDLCVLLMCSAILWAGLWSLFSLGKQVVKARRLQARQESGEI